MKRLLASGNDSIYQICKAFRDGEAGRLHNPEFTLLEWYRVDYDHHMLMDEVEEFVSPLLGLETRFQRLTYHHAFERYTGLDLHAASDEALQGYVDRFTDIQVNDGAAVDYDAWLDLIMSHVVEPRLAVERPTFIYDYPASKAAMAAVRNGASRIAERFELYVAGIELANGFRELSNKEEQRRRFERDREQRQRNNMPDVPCAGRLLAALDSGLPSCAGVALGLDRLLMLRLEVDSIKDILAFPLDRA
jgi:lysyl-tRNA synthetase class 2